MAVLSGRDRELLVVKARVDRVRVVKVRADKARVVKVKVVRARVGQGGQGQGSSQSRGYRGGRTS